MTDLFDLLDEKPAGTETVWEKIQAAHAISSSMADHYLDVLFADDPWLPEIGFASKGDQRLVLNRRGFWLNRDHTGAPDVTWKQVVAELERQATTLTVAEWAELETLWAEKEAARRAWNAADVPNLHSRPNKDVLLVREVEAKRAYLAAWKRMRDRFVAVYGFGKEVPA